MRSVVRAILAKLLRSTLPCGPATVRFFLQGCSAVHTAKEMSDFTHYYELLVCELATPVACLGMFWVNSSDALCSDCIFAGPPAYLAEVHEPFSFTKCHAGFLCI